MFSGYLNPEHNSGWEMRNIPFSKVTPEESDGFTRVLRFKPLSDIPERE